MKKVKKMAFGGSPAQTGMKPPVAKPTWQTVSKAAKFPSGAPIPAKKAVGSAAPYKGPVPVTPPGGQVQDKINTKPPLNKMGDILSGRAPAPTTPSIPNKPPVGYADDLKELYERGPAISKGSMPPTPSGRLTGPFSGPAPVPTPAPQSPSKPLTPAQKYASSIGLEEQLRLMGHSRKLSMKKGGAVKAYAKGGKVSSASSRGDGIAQRGKTKGRMI